MCQANIGKSKVLEGMHLADEPEDHPFYHNSHVKECLTKGIKALFSHIADELERIKEMTGIAVE